MLDRWGSSLELPGKATECLIGQEHSHLREQKTLRSLDLFWFPLEPFSFQVFIIPCRLLHILLMPTARSFFQLRSAIIAAIRQQVPAVWAFFFSCFKEGKSETWVSVQIVPDCLTERVLQDNASHWLFVIRHLRELWSNTFSSARFALSIKLKRHPLIRQPWLHALFLPG